MHSPLHDGFVVSATTTIRCSLLADRADVANGFVRRKRILGPVLFLYMAHQTRGFAEMACILPTPMRDQLPFFRFEPWRDARCPTRLINSMQESMSPQPLSMKVCNTW